MNEILLVGIIAAVYIVYLAVIYKTIQLKNRKFEEDNNLPY